MSIKYEKVKKIRCKDALVNGMNYDEIVNTVWDIMEDCDEISCYSKEDFEELADILGNDEEAYELQMTFGTLSADCNQLYKDLQDYDIPEYFNDFFVAVKGGNFGGLGIYDEEEGDYFGLDSYDMQEAESISRKRIARLTKAEIIDTATKCFRIFMAFMGVQSRYQDLKTAIDILKDRHSGLLQTIKRIEELYEKAAEVSRWGCDYREFERLLDSLPYDIWVQ